MGNHISILVFYKKEDSGFKIWFQPRHSGPDARMEFPGGKIEPGETPKEAAVREIFEEVDVEVDPDHVNLFKVYQDYKEFHVFTYNIRHLDAELNPEGWFNFEQAIPEDFPTFPINHQMIKELYENKNYLL